jgi:hypothetical protein
MRLPSEWASRIISRNFGVAEPSRRGVAFRVLATAAVDAPKSLLSVGRGETRRPGIHDIAAPWTMKYD